MQSFSFIHRKLPEICPLTDARSQLILPVANDSHFTLKCIGKQEVSLKKIIVEGYRAVGSLHDRTFCCCCCSLLILDNGKTYKSAIKRPIKIQTHHVVRKHAHRLTNRRQAVRADRQLDECSDGQTGRFVQIRYPRIQLLSLSENGKAKEST